MLTAAAAIALLVTVVAAIILFRSCARILSEARASRRLFEANVEGLSRRAHRAKQTDRERARHSADVAEATSALSKRIIAAQHALLAQRQKFNRIDNRSAPPAAPNRTLHRTS